jgi:hypothetical protein
MTDSLEFTVEEWTADESSVFEVLARCSNLMIARGAFTAAVKMRPNAVILLRHGSRVIERHSQQASSTRPR